MKVQLFLLSLIQKMIAIHKSQSMRIYRSDQMVNVQLQKRSLSSGQMECYVCECPLFQPRPTCAFCGKGACKDHLRKLRQYERKQAMVEDNSKPSFNSDLRPICDQCQDLYLISKLNEQQPDFAFSLKAVADTESFFMKDEQRMLQKVEGISAQFKAKQMKYSILMEEKRNGFVDVEAKAQQTAAIEAQIEQDYSALDQFQKLLQAAQSELLVLQAQPFVSLENDLNILSAESSKLTKDLLKLDKGISDLKQNIKKTENQIKDAYDSWEKKQQDKKAKKSGDQKTCVLF